MRWNILLISGVQLCMAIAHIAILVYSIFHNVEYHNDANLVDRADQRLLQ